MPKEARKHHYLPQFYLAAFTPSGSRKDFLWVLDKNKNECRRSKPLNAAVQKDYYRVDVPGLESSFIEDHFATVEAHIAKLFRNILADERMPDHGEFEDIIAFAAQICVRGPKMRSALRKSLLESSDAMARMTLSNKDRWETIVSQLRKESIDFPDAPSFEEVRGSYEQGDIYPVPNQELEIMVIIKSVIDLTPILMARKWSLLVSSEPDVAFVTSDAAVTPFWNKPGNQNCAPGFGLESVDVLFPLSRRIALLGLWDTSPGTRKADRRYVAYLNAVTMASAERYAYCSSPECPALLPDGGIGTAKAFLSILANHLSKRHKEKPPPRR